jgi:hypothetical protein
MDKHLLDSFKPRARDVVAFSLSVRRDKYNLTLCSHQKVDYSCAASPAFALSRPPQFAATACPGNYIAGIRTSTEKYLKRQEFLVRK